MRNVYNVFIKMDDKIIFVKENYFWKTVTS